MSSTSTAIAKMLAPLRRQIALMLGRAIVELAKDSGAIQLVQLTMLAGETDDDVERVQNYGFTAVPLAGAEAVFVCFGGNRNHPVAIAVDDRRHRKSGLQAGEVALYTDEGDYILLKRGRIVEVKAGTKLRVDAPLAELTGDATIAGTLAVTGNITSQADITATGNVADQGGAKTMAGMRTVYNTHAHADPQGGSTGAPSAPM